MRYLLVVFSPLIPAKAKFFDKYCNAEDKHDIYSLVHKPIFQYGYYAKPITGSVIPVASENQLDPKLSTKGSDPIYLFQNWAMYYKGGWQHYLIPQVTTVSATDNILELIVILFSVLDGTIQTPLQNQSLATNLPTLVQRMRDSEGMMFHEPYRSDMPFHSFTENTYVPGFDVGEETVGVFFRTSGAETSVNLTWAYSCDDNFRFGTFTGVPNLLKQ